MEDKYSSLLKSKLIDPYNSLYLLACKPNIISEINNARILINEKFVYYTSVCKMIQKCFRNYIKNINYMDKLCRNYNSETKYINSETFLGIKIEEIPSHFFYSLVDQLPISEFSSNPPSELSAPKVQISKFLNFPGYLYL